MDDKIFEDNDLKAYVDEKVKPLLPLRHTIAGTAGSAFDNNFRTVPWDTPLGDLVCDALAESGAKYGTRIAFENRGGIRGRIEAGPISLEEIQSVFPFDNKEVCATVGGACLMQILEHSVSGGLGGPFFDTHGLKFAYDPTKDKGHRLVFVLAQDQAGKWKPIVPEEKYKIAVNDYSFGGGEGYDFKTASDIVREPEKVSDAVTEFLHNHHDIVPQFPQRIVPVTQGLLSVDGHQVLQVRNVPPEAKLIFVSGPDKGGDASSHFEEGEPVCAE